MLLMLIACDSFFNYRTNSGSLRESGVMVYLRLSHCLPNILNGHGDGGRLE